MYLERCDLNNTIYAPTLLLLTIRNNLPASNGQYHHWYGEYHIDPKVRGYSQQICSIIEVEEVHAEQALTPVSNGTNGHRSKLTAQNVAGR
jgi:hypothetical protein